MKDIIRLLPDSIANQIAAGEVVQRPSSVVKELMENAIDAGATRIEVIIKEGGKTFIQIIDNGIGMSEIDARMCFERHATSKIDSSDDLFRLTTLGFRGEALASIAAVAQIDLKTKRQQDEIGTQLIIEGSTFKSQEPVQLNGGTSITVKNLFFNVPARRNFLKSNAVETKHILEEFQRLALAYPAIHFSFYEQDEEMYSLPSSKLSQRIVNLFGKSYQEQLVACSESTDLIKIEGYIGKPEFSKKTRGEQFFFVNKRFIKSSYLHHAVIGAFEGLLPEGSFPFYVLFIEINPALIDVNVHPTKTEIKFEDEKMVYAILRAAVRRSLSVNHVTPSLDFEQSINLMNELDVKNKSNQTSTSNYSKKNNSFDTDLYYSSFSKESNLIIPSESNEKIDSSLIKIEETKPAPYQLHQRYIIASIKSGCMMIDQCAAYERIVYDKYIAYAKQETIPSQQLLFPQTIQLNPTSIQILMDMEQEVKSLGFGFEFLGKDTIVMNGIPCDILLGEEKELIEELINQFQYHSSDNKLNKNEKMIQFIAKKASSRYEVKLLPQEMISLIDKLFACSNPNYSPSGKRICITWDINELASLFK